MKIPFPPSSPDPGTDGMLKGGFASWGVSPALERCRPQLLLSKGLLPPQALQLCPPCANSFLPNVILISSSSLVRAGLLAGSCVPLGEGLEVCGTRVSFAQGKEG